MGRSGIFLIVAGAACGLAIAVYNYFSPAGFLSPLSNTAGTPGALLVVGSTALMLVAALVLAGRSRARFVTWFLGAGILLDVAGTGLAAVLLESMPLLVAMAVAGVGWLMWAFGGRNA